MCINHLRLAVLITLWLSATFSNGQTRSPNIILILADDQGWGTTSVLMDEQVKESASDYYRTPNLEALAKKGVVFSSGYSPHSNCSPSRASILTGKSPAQLKLTDIIERNTGPLYQGNFLIPPQHVDRLSDEELTIAEWIRQHRPDYASAHFGKWHLANGGPKMNGFDEGDGATTNREGDKNPSDDPKQVYSLTKRGIAWMEEQVAKGKPFYLQLSHYAVHLSMAASPSSLKEVAQWPEGGRHNDKMFAAMTKDLDNSVGLLLNRLKELGIDNNTYIIYTSDNGTYPTNDPANINGPLHGWKASLWEGGIRVPFIISGPGISPGVSNVPVVGYDIFPTICAWLGINKLPDGVEGGSLLPLLQKADNKVERTRDFLVFHFPHYQLQKAIHPTTALFRGMYKLLKFHETGALRLYKLDEDLAETKDLSAIYPEVVAELSTLMNNYLTEIDAGLPKINPRYNAEKDPGKNYKDVKLKLMNEPYFLIEK